MFFFFTLVTDSRRSLGLSDTRVYEPYIRARLGNHNTPIPISIQARIRFAVGFATAFAVCCTGVPPPKDPPRTLSIGPR